MKTFSSFMSSKDRENKQHLHILQKILEKAGFDVQNFLNDTKEPYIYVKKPIEADQRIKKLSFGGIRLYTRGTNIICYRSQNRANTEPFGSSYSLNIEDMFKELVKDKDKKILGYQIIFYIIKELKDFFIKSATSEKEAENDPNEVIIGTQGSDFLNQLDRGT